MSKKSQKLIRRLVECERIVNKVSTAKFKDRCVLNISIKADVLKRWNALKLACSCETDEDFITNLLELAQDRLNRQNSGSLKNGGINAENCSSQKENKLRQRSKKIKQKKINQYRKEKKEEKQKRLARKQEETLSDNSINDETTNLTEFNKKVLDSEERKDCNDINTNDLSLNDKNYDITFNNYSILKANLMKKTNNCNNVVSDSSNADSGAQTDEKLSKKKKFNQASPEKAIKKEKFTEVKDLESDIRRAPKLEIQGETLSEIKTEKSDVTNKIPPGQNICITCNSQHVQDKCSVYFAHYIVNDSLTYEEWKEKYKQILEKIKSEIVQNEKELECNTNDDKDKYSFAKLSLPSILYLDGTDNSHGLGVFSKNDLEAFTQLGPLIGNNIKEVDISEESSMRDIWEIASGNGNNYVSTEDIDTSNWIRFIRPAPIREERNVTVIKKDTSLYFVTIRQIKSEEELLFWQDCPVSTNKKRLEKTSCGGCNMIFSHPIYYRTHCSVFHDLRYSLTIRKYHCKVCGAAVLGKENIMKHAAELHNGQGAYQCQFCKKFFLRLNYLEMHRTYGCSANPHRSRPLCDFCGRKFCQPQKLKVHIKRMHSDFSEVLKEFQCKICLKILGSRAALQRHSKEVHQKQVDNTCSCIRCGKRFQNKSNLKIHMLTHSGIKPFKCAVKSCNAAFTTKQCLQFHYKKVHNLAEEAMPKIERSVDYTFEAYSGLEDGEMPKEDKSNIHNDSTAATLDEGSDFDDTSIDSKTLDDPPAIQSPLQLTNEPSPEPSPPPVENYNVSGITTATGMKILSKGSKKWIADDQPPMQNQQLRTDLYQIDQNRMSKDDLSNLTLQEPPIYDRTKLNTNLNTFARHESSNASLLVEAALDSVCSEPNIDIDVSSTPNCTDTLVNNLYTLAPNDGLPDVSYSESVCMNEPRDINLISPSVNDHISVTDELGDELRQNQSMGMDYSTFHQEDFSPANSPGIHQRNTFVRNYINSLSPSNNQNYSNNQAKNMSPVPSPPRYDFGHAVNTEHLSSDESNGMSAQNLSLHNTKNDIQLDLSIYKSPYKLDPPSFQPRKDFRIRFDTDNDRNKVYLLGVDNVKNYQDENHLDQNHVESLNQTDLEGDIDNVDITKDKETENNERTKYADDLANDLRHKFELDLDLRIKSYDPVDIEALRSKNTYDAQNDLDFRSKNYDLIDSIENRNKTYESTIDSEFRTDRNFEPLMLNSSELQGLDMSARSFHNYPNINRYHHLYPDVDRVDLRLNYSPPPPSYTHADILRVVSLDLTPPGRHSVDLSLRSHPLHQIANSRLLTEHSIQTNSHRLLDQTRLLSSDLTAARHLGGEARLLNEASSRILSDHTTNRILSNSDQLSSNHLLSSEQSRLMSDDSRLISDPTRLLDQTRLITDGRILPPTTPSGTVSPVPTFTGYSVSQSPYHSNPLAPRPHVTSPTPTPYHHYSPYY